MELKLRYHSPAPDSADGWEKYSMPIGNSYLGGNVFGGLDYERIQITENSLQSPNGGLSSFADIFVRFSHNEEAVSGYERGLDIGNAMAYVQYDWNGIHVERNYYATYPDRAIAGSITASDKISMEIELQIAYLTEEAGREKRGQVVSEGNLITMAGVMNGYNIHYEGQLAVFTDGVLTAADGKLYVKDATVTRFLFCGATNYELRPEVFIEPNNAKKLREFDPHDLVCDIMKSASSHTWEELLLRHNQDYHNLFGRVTLDLGETEVPNETTEELLKMYAEGHKSHYLEVLYFQFGRYLLISSSRPGCLPANLQGVWNCHDKSPWGSGYWHNINVQMNYWPAFITNLAETFIAYKDFNLAFRPAAEKFASDYIKATVPEKYTDEPGECGWTIGTGNYPYLISGPGGHSGPGTGGLTSKLFWEYYDFTGDKNILREVAYPALLSMTKHLLRVVRKYDGLYLAAFSASPEQIITEYQWSWGSSRIQYHHTIGCAFDQQMIWENGNDLLKCVAILGEDTLPEKDLAVISELKEQMEHYDPVQVGWSGQIKEYREEKFYGEIGEYQHRHISQLVGLHPGTLISTETPAWMDAAKLSLNLRSDESTGWALAHRLNAWARTGDGNRAYKLYGELLGTRTMPNLWDTHPPFQIDGNFGGTAGVAEMLLQSHEKCIAPLACIPDDWKEGSFTGLAARGGFVLDVEWKNGCAKKITVHSLAGNECRIRYCGIAHASADFAFTPETEDIIVFATEKGKTYTVTEIPVWEKLPAPAAVRVNRKQEVTWDFEGPVNVWRAIDSSPCYDLIAIGATGGYYKDTGCDIEKCENITYKITRGDAMNGGADGAVVTLHHATRLEWERYCYWIKQINNPDSKIRLPEYYGE